MARNDRRAGKDGIATAAPSSVSAVYEAQLAYDRGVLDGMIQAALIVRREKRFGDLSLLACDIEDVARASDDPSKCSHPFWRLDPDGRDRCRTCGTDVSHIDPMGG